MEIKEMAIEELIPYENNPRRNENAVDAVAKSIKEFGFKVPLVIDSENVIVTGHTRLRAAQKLGFEKVPCIIASDLTPNQLKAFRLVDNKVSELAAWDLALLDEEFRSITDVDLNGFGWDISERGLRHLSWAKVEKLCDLKKRFKQFPLGKAIYSTFFEVGKKGIPIDKIKQDKANVEPFADCRCDWLDKVVGNNLSKGDWCLVTTPRRRHKEGFHFATEICRSAAQKLSLKFYPETFSAKDRNRIYPEFYLEKKPKESNVILFDDIVTTGETIRTCRQLLLESGYIVLCVIAIRNITIKNRGVKNDGTTT